MRHSITARVPAEGFTLIELIVVIAVIAALAAIGLPTINYMRHKGCVAATEVVVKNAAMMIATRQERHWTVDDGSGTPVTYRIWDVNNDGLLDGRPDLENPGLASSQKYPAVILAAGSGYYGFIANTQFEVPERHVNELCQVIDAWGNPLHIGYGREAYGALGIGVWSIGADGTDGTEDDITSWELGEVK